MVRPWRHATHVIGRPVGRRGRFALAVALGGLAFAVGLTGLRDPDTFHLMAMGREMVRRGGFPAEDPFLFPLAGIPAGPPPSWLAAVVIYLARAGLGPTGPVWLAGLLLGTVLAVMALDALDPEYTVAEALVALVPLLLALTVLRWRSVARPELFGNVFLASFMLLLRRHVRRGSQRPIWALPALAVLWINFHPSAVAGVGLALVLSAAGAAQFLVCRLVCPWPTWAPEGRSLLAAAASSLVAGMACLLHPATWRPLAQALAFAANQFGLEFPGALPGELLPLLRTGVEELRPLSFEWLGPFGILLMLAAVSLVASVRRDSLAQAAVSAVAVAVALSAERFAGLAMIVLAPLTGRNLVIGLERFRLTQVPAARVFAAAVATIAAGTLIGSVVRAEGGPTLSFRPERFPVRAAQVLKAISFSGRIYNTFDFGGYLEWELGGKVFQDGRLALQRGDEAAAFTDTGHDAAFAALDRKHRFDALVVAYPALPFEMVEVLAGTAPDRDWVAPAEEWSLVAFDEGALLYLRRDGPYRDLAHAREYRVARPGNPFPLMHLRDQRFAIAYLAELERATAESPWCRRCRWRLALTEILLRDDRRRAESLVGERARPSLYVRYGDMLHDLGNAAGARRAYAQALGMDDSLAAPLVGVSEVLDLDDDERIVAMYRLHYLERHRERLTWLQSEGSN